jgi:two-component system response regulator FixJ
MRLETHPTVYVVDDDDAVRRSLSMLLDGAGFRVQEFASGEAMLAALARGDRPACAVVDMRMGEGMTGLDVQRALAARPNPPPVIIVTGHGDVPLAVAAMRLGVVNFIEKPYPADALLDAVSEAAAVTPPQPRELPALTPREREVLAALVAGRSNKEIARDIGISHRTVEVHRASLMTRLGARNLAEAVRMGLAAGLG